MFSENLTFTPTVFCVWHYLNATAKGRELLQLGVDQFWLAWSSECLLASSAAAGADTAGGQPVFYVLTKDRAEHTLFPCACPPKYRQGAATVLWV